MSLTQKDRKMIFRKCENCGFKIKRKCLGGSISCPVCGGNLKIKLEPIF